MFVFRTVRQTAEVGLRLPSRCRGFANLANREDEKNSQSSSNNG
jgi:hypothetical protein